ncbi:hypothetical protein [Pectobacterium brasiliense]
MRRKFGVTTLVAFIITVPGIITPIIWDYYNGKKGISLTLVSYSKIISPMTDVDGLEFIYKNKKLNALSKATFLIENTGSTPVLESDIVTPIKIKFPYGGNILDTTIDSMIPSNLDFSLMKDTQEVIINFSLLNPGDKAFISLLTDSKEINFEASARIVGINEININYEPPKTLTIWAFFWIPVGFSSLVLLLASLNGFYQYPKEFRIKKLLRRNQFLIPKFISYEDAYLWVEENFDFATSDEIASIIQYLKGIEENNGDINNNSLLSVIRKSVLSSLNNLIVGLIVFSIGLFGIYYSLISMGYL